MTTITEADIRKCQMQQAAHLNGGADWFGYIYRCVQHPRLTRRDTYTRKDKSVKSEWHVDMQPVADLAEAATKLSVPYPVTPAQVELLKLVPIEFTLLEDRVRFVMLAEFGLVEFKNGACRLTETGKAAIK